MLDTVKFFRRHQFFGVVLLAGLLVTACGARIGTGWPAVSTVGEEQNILLAYMGQVVLVDPIDGSPIALRNPEGELRLDDQGNPRQWSVSGDNVSGAEFYSSPLVLEDDSLLIAGYNNHLYEVELTTARVYDPEGIEIAGPVIADPVMTEDTLYVAYSDGDIVALDRADLGGEPRWTFETGRGIWARPLLQDGILYFSSIDHNLYAVNAKSGEEIWKLDLQGAASATPVYRNGHLYIGSFARKVFDITTDGGSATIVDEYTTENWVWGAPVLVDGVLYVTDLSGFVFALDTTNGLTELWKSQVAERGIRASPLVTDEVVIVAGRDGKVYWLDRESGTLVFERELEGLPEILSELLLIEPTDMLELPEPLVVVSSVAGNQLLVAFTLNTGQRAWVYPR